MGFDTKVNWDEGAFKDAASQGLKKMASQLQEAYDSVLSTHGGSSEEEVRAALHSALLARDLKPNVPDEFVAAIASGQRVVVKPKEV